MTHRLNSRWNVWIHEFTDDNWKLNSYKNIYQFNTIEEFWSLANEIKNIDVMFFIMRNEIKPIYEVPENTNGGQMTFICPLSILPKIFTELMVHLISEKICNNPLEINGISVTTRQTNGILKIWVKDYDKFNIGLKNKSIKVSSYNKYIQNFRFKKHAF